MDNLEDKIRYINYLIHKIMPDNSFMIQMGQQLGGGILGLGLQGLSNSMQREQQRKLTNIQVGAQKNLLDYQNMKQLDMWRATSYPAQIEMLKAAGLNPGLLYGMGGAGGATTGGGTPGVTGGHAEGGMGILSMAQTAAQLGLLKAQKENIEADTANKTATKPNIEQDTKLKAVQTELGQVQASVARMTIMDQVHAIENIAAKGAAEIAQQQMQNQITLTTMNDQIKQIRATAVGALIENSLKEANINKTRQEIDKMVNDMLLGWEQLAVEQQKNRIAAFTAQFQANHPGIMQVLGGAIQRLADGISKPLNERKIQ